MIKFCTRPKLVNALYLFLFILPIISIFFRHLAKIMEVIPLSRLRRSVNGSVNGFLKNGLKINLNDNGNNNSLDLGVDARNFKEIRQSINGNHNFVDKTGNFKTGSVYGVSNGYPNLTRLTSIPGQPSTRTNQTPKVLPVPPIKKLECQDTDPKFKNLPPELSHQDIHLDERAQYTKYTNILAYMYGGLWTPFFLYQAIFAWIPYKIMRLAVVYPWLPLPATVSDVLHVVGQGFQLSVPIFYLTKQTEIVKLINRQKKYKFKLDRWLESQQDSDGDENCEERLARVWK